MAHFLPIKRRNGLSTVGLAVNGSNRIEITDRGGVAREIVNEPDTTPALGGKFPVYTVAGVRVDLAYTSSSTGTEIESVISTVTSGDARTAARYVVRDGEPMMLQARITNALGEPYAYGAFSSITVSVYDQSTGGGDIYIPADPALASVFQSSLVAWPYDDEGYNFSLEVLPAHLTGGVEGGHVYKIEVNAVLNTGGSRLIEGWYVIRSEASA